MDDLTKIRSAEPSRRSMLRSLALTAGSAAVLGASASRHRAAAAQTKVAQKVVAYRTPRRARCAVTIARNSRRPRRAKSSTAASHLPAGARYIRRSRLNTGDGTLVTGCGFLMDGRQLLCGEEGGDLADLARGSGSSSFHA